MTAKYHCSQCGKRYVDWGAKNLDFKCPDCEDGKLVPVGQTEAASPKKKPSLKRKRASKKKVSPPATPEELGIDPKEIEGVASLDVVPGDDVVVGDVSLDGDDGQLDVELVNDVTDTDSTPANDSPGDDNVAGPVGDDKPAGKK